MKLLTGALVTVVLLSACGSKKPAPQAPPPTTDTAAAGDGVKLALGEMKLVDVNKNKAILIHADGSIEFEGQKGVKVTADGKLMRVDNGEVGFELKPDGTILGPDKQPLDVTLDANATIKSGDKSISLDDKGALVGANPDAPQMRVDGATTVGLKRTALFVLIAITTPDRPSAPSTPTTPPK
ncbi:MAG TPA: hypothetical protein VFQ53_31715 [Kofleriaceae bacterium]|nr:hypothetical protein [Kofleriaceae bacterium]